VYFFTFSTESVGGGRLLYEGEATGRRRGSGEEWVRGGGGCGYKVGDLRCLVRAGGGRGFSSSWGGGGRERETDGKCEETLHNNTQEK